MVARAHGNSGCASYVCKCFSPNRSCNLCLTCINSAGLKRSHLGRPDDTQHLLHLIGSSLSVATFACLRASERRSTPLSHPYISLAIQPHPTTCVYSLLLLLPLSGPKRKGQHLRVGGRQRWTAVGPLRRGRLR